MMHFGFLFLVLVVVESSFVSLPIGSDRSDKQWTVLHEKRTASEFYDSSRRKYLVSSLISVVALPLTDRPVFAIDTGTSADNGMVSTKNKKIGGLALKIRSVGHIMVSGMFTNVPTLNIFEAIICCSRFVHATAL